MKQQILIINGGNTFAKEEDYINSLKEVQPTLERITYRGNWKHSLPFELGTKFEILMPQMPNPGNAKYDVWRRYFEKIVPLLNDDVIIIGHSLGGVFLAKYLTKHQVKNKAIILIAAPFDDESEESLGGFSLKGWGKFIYLEQQNVWLIHSKDDPVVLSGELEKYKKALPRANVMFFTDRQHFNQPEFPELVNLLRAL